MIVTIKTDKPGVASFEAMKHGIEIESYADGTMDLIVHSLDKANLILGYSGGKILSVLDRALA